MQRVKVLMISHLFPGSPASSNPSYGVFVKEMLREYNKLVEVFVYVPIDVMPGLRQHFRQKGIAGKFRPIWHHFHKTLFEKPPDFHTPVEGKFVRFLSLPFKSFAPFLPGISLFFSLMVHLFFLRKHFRFDIIHAHTISPDGFAAVLLSKVFRCPTVVTVHGSDVHSVGKNILAQKTVDYVLQSAGRIACVSMDLRKRIERLGIASKKITVINNGISTDFLDNKGIKNIRLELHIPENAPLILSVIKLVQVKDPVTLIDAFSLVRKKSPFAHLLVVGGGDMESELRQYLYDKKLVESVRLTGFVPYSHIPSYMAACDVFCMSSLREGFPTVLFEAMAFGKPVVATKVGGIPEAICSEDYGFLVDAEQPTQLSVAILKALKKKWDQPRIMAYAMDNTWEKVGRKYLDVYQDELTQ
jgi:glycosyltransferase involved in cell wall biosynthesis